MGRRRQQRVSFYQLEEWSQFRKALVVRVEDGQAERVLEYESPPEHCPDGLPSHVFKAATIEEGTAYLCTQTEVLVCDFPSFAHPARDLAAPASTTSTT